MSYKVKNTIVSLPLTVEAVVDYVESSSTQESLDEIKLNNLKLKLYRDVLVCVRTGAAHARELATEALKLEDLKI